MSIEKKLMTAATRILRPLVRIFLRNGIPSDAMSELVRRTYVEVAESEFRLDGKRQTTARISVITGLNRKEVARLRGLEKESDADRVRWNRAATVLGGWLRDKRFQDRKGDPLDLSFDRESPSFAELVRAYSGDMQPRAVADELLRVGAVETVGEKLRMTTHGYVPSQDPESVVEILGMDTAELIDTIDHNMQSNAEERLLQLKVLSDNVPAEYLHEFNAYSRRLARPVLEELNRWLAERDLGQDWGGEDERVVLGLGIYQINRPADREAAAAAKTSESDLPKESRNDEE